jgi:putative oxidoreductase
MIQPFFVFSDWAFFILRIVLAAVMIYHGIPKLKNPSMTGESFSKMGFRPGIFWARITGILETVGGVFILIGFLTQAISLLFIIQFLVILVKLKRLKSMKEYEFDLVLLAAFMVLAAVGGGAADFDGFFSIILY